MTPPPLVVAIDGPAGAGKSTAAKRLAAQLGLPFVDTGAMYRAAALYLRERGIDVDDGAAVAALVPELPISLTLDDGAATVRLEGEIVDKRIRSAEIGALTSRVAVHPELRAAMVARQRAFVSRHGGVMEGRDIGTVVVPGAPCKFFLDASPETRARRRHSELAAGGQDPSLPELERQLRERDRRDSSRASSPLVAAPGATVIATDGLTIDEVVARMRELVAERSASVG
ncbi:MAG: (d)CMP kinase [Thermoanaerobaculia bacterium]